MKKPHLQRYLSLLQHPHVVNFFKVDHFQSTATYALIFIFILWTFFASLRPLNLEQQRDLHAISQQDHYPMAREMALALLQQQSVNRYQYFRVLRATHIEQRHIIEHEQIHIEVQKSSNNIY